MRFHRQKASMTLKGVAEKSNLSAGFISQVERGISMPSLTSLYAVAKALGVGVEDFVSTSLWQVETDSTHRQGRRIFRLDESERSYELLKSGFDDARLNACLAHVPPGYESDLMSHEGEDFIYLIRGSVTYEIDGVHYPLEQGGTLHFQSARPHRLRNTGTEIATELWVGTMRISPGTG